MQAPTFFVIKVSFDYNDWDVVTGTIHRIVDCARTRAHADAVAARLRRQYEPFSDSSFYVAQRDGAGHMRECAPVRPWILDEADVGPW